MSMDFEGRKLIVVGGTSGIGEASAKSVLERGGAAVLIGKRGTSCGQRSPAFPRPAR